MSPVLLASCSGGVVSQGPAHGHRRRWDSSPACSSATLMPVCSFDIPDHMQERGVYSDVLDTLW